MLTYANGGRLVESLSELPRLDPRDLYLDLETTSGDDKLDALNPWHHCKIAGIAVTCDDIDGAWYVPLRHRFGTNLDIDVVKRWVADLIKSAKRWINHNVKYDAQVLANDLGVEFSGDFICTVVQSKIIDSDRMGHDLTSLAKAWLHHDISHYEAAIKRYVKKDYGACPADVMGEYACEDVLTNRRLHKYIDAHMPDQCRRISGIEIGMTRVLYDMEREGMHVDLQELDTQQLITLVRMQQADEALHQLVGRSVNPTSNPDCFDVLCNQYGLPVLGWTEGDEDEPAGNPSFDKHTLKKYLALPNAPTAIVEAMLTYRQLKTYDTHFLTAYKRFNINGVLHPSINQLVRTGRMSCKMPNMQQLMAAAKALIHPKPGQSILACDDSQIEFRLIAHYIEDRYVLDAYKRDPDTDFHQWVADMCKIHRKPAKTINFLMGYGGGKKRLLAALSTIKELIGDIIAKVDEAIAHGEVDAKHRAAIITKAAMDRANDTYDMYHETLPGLKITSRAASRAAELRGYVFNLYGRRRILPKERAHIAFNTVCQGSAGDMMKDRLVKLHGCLPKYVKLIMNVHDEIVCTGPSEAVEDPRTLDGIVNVMEHPSVSLKVPVRCHIGTSRKHWLEASKTCAARFYSINASLEHLAR